MKSLSALLALTLLASSLSATPEITNHESNSTVRYPVVLLRGTVEPDAGTIFATNESKPADHPTHSLTGVVRKGQFKVLAELVPGENTLTLKSDASETPTPFTLHYQPQTNPYYVRVIWMTDNSGDTDYATCVENDPQNYADKLDTAAKLMQTFTAERNHALGYGRKTFRLKLDNHGKVVVHTLKAPKPASYYHGLEKGWYGEVHQWLNKEHPDKYAKNIVLAAYTRKDPETGKMLAHTALGGGNLGLFGSASIFTWPNGIDTTMDAFLNTDKVDASKIHDDSNGRHNFWGIASTTIGATLHEMGHTFGLPHCRDRFGIMTRGFDHFNRAFTLHDAPSGRSLKPYAFKETEVARFAPISASFLQWSRWFQPDGRAYPDDQNPLIEYNHDTETFTVESPHGIRWIGLWHKDNVSAFHEFQDNTPLTRVQLTRKECESELSDGETLSRMTVLSNNGQHARLNLPGKN
jgi:hypothetical protein